MVARATRTTHSTTPTTFKTTTKPPSGAHLHAYAKLAFLATIATLLVALYVVNPTRFGRAAVPVDLASDFAQAWVAGSLDSLDYDPSSGPGVNPHDAGTVADTTTRLVRDIATLDQDKPIAVTLDGDPVLVENTQLALPVPTRGPISLRIGDVIQPLKVTWKLDNGTLWNYRTNVIVRSTDDTRRVVWIPSLVHPALVSGLHIKADRIAAQRGVITTRKGMLSENSAPQVIGMTGPATKEQAQAAGPLVWPGDPVGRSGIQGQHNERLTGSPGIQISTIADTDTTATDTTQVVGLIPATPGRPVIMTLDPEQQRRANLAVLTEPGAALVAIDTGTGSIVATANSGNSTVPTGLVTQRPVGSMMRPVTMLALLRQGTSPQTASSCQAISVDGQPWYPPAGTEPGVHNLGDAVTANCPVALAAAAANLPHESLTQAATDLGWGDSVDVGVPAYAGSIPRPSDARTQVAAAMGTDGGVVTALGLARTASVIATGQLHSTTLLSDPLPSDNSGGRHLSASEQQTLYALLARSVQVDPAIAPIRRVTDAQVAAICGPAGPPGAAGRPDQWFLGIHGSQAVGILVPNNTDPQVAARVAAEFWQTSGR